MRALIVCTLTLLGGMAARADTIEGEYHESFDVGAGDRLVLESGDGDVDVRPWDRDVLDVHVVYRAEHSGTFIGVREPDDFTVDFERVGDAVRVMGREPGSVNVGIGWRSRNIQEYLYTIRAPAWLGLEIRGDDGDVTIADWAGPIELHGEDGGATFAGLAGGVLEVRLDDGDVAVADSRVDRARIVTEDGDVTMRDVEGRIAVESDDGNVELDGVRSPELSIALADGDARVALAPVEAPRIDVATEDGDVVLRLPRGLSASFSVATDDGRLEVELPEAVDLERSERRVEGRLGSGAGRIGVHTDDGDVTLRTD